MPSEINLRLEGPYEGLYPGSLINALRHFWRLLQDLDATISKDPRGTTNWDIQHLSKSSPAVIAFVGQSHLTTIDHTHEIENDCIQGLKLLSASGERLPSYSDAAISKALRLAKLCQRRAHQRLDLIEVSASGERVAIGPDTVANIESLTATKYESLGSIVGNLDAITVRNGTEFRVWEEVSGQPVTCRFTEEMLEQVEDSLGLRVLVYGDVRANYKGQIIGIYVHGFGMYADEANLPPIKEMSGLVDDFTGGMPLKDYLEEIRSG